MDFHAILSMFVRILMQFRDLHGCSCTAYRQEEQRVLLSARYGEYFKIQYIYITMYENQLHYIKILLKLLKIEKLMFLINFCIIH